MVRVSVCVINIDDVVRQVGELVNQPLTVNLVENTTSVVVPEHVTA